jgi:hypothetical protein
MCILGAHRVSEIVSAGRLTRMLTWRHRPELTERDVATKFIDQLVQFTKSNVDIPWDVDVAGVKCCLRTYARFNDLYSPDEGEHGRPSRIFRRYKKYALRGGQLKLTAIEKEQLHRSNNAQKRLHCQNWIIDRIKNTLGQTFHVATRQSDGTVQTNVPRRVEHSGWVYRISPPVMCHEYTIYKRESVGAGVSVYAKTTLFTICWADVITTNLNVEISRFNNVTGECIISSCSIAAASYHYPYQRTHHRSESDERYF